MWPHVSSVISPYFLEPLSYSLKYSPLLSGSYGNLLSDSWARMKLLLQCSRLKGGRAARPASRLSAVLTLEVSGSVYSDSLRFANAPLRKKM